MMSQGGPMLNTIHDILSKEALVDQENNIQPLTTM